MEKRYQVFVSSTYGDLRAERQEVMQALLELDCIPSGMELFPAADEDQWTLIKDVIDDCDYYFVIIAGRYGSLGPEGVSFTQMEYEYAVSTKKPVIAFLHNEPGKIQSDKTDPEHSAKLLDFRELAQKKMCKSWATPHELGSVVSRSLIKLIKDKPGIGWVRGSLVPDENAMREMLRLRTENDDLKRALEMAKSEPPSGSEVFAFGEEVFSGHFTYSDIGQNSHHETVSVSWIKWFEVLAPIMIGGAADGELKDKLAEFFRNRRRDQSKTTAYSPRLRDQDFQQIKIQLRALGLVRLEDVVNASDSVTGYRWFLTPYGDTVMTQAVAIRSEKSGKE